MNNLCIECNRGYFTGSSKIETGMLESLLLNAYHKETQQKITRWKQIDTCNN